MEWTVARRIAGRSTAKIKKPSHAGRLQDLNTASEAQPTNRPAGAGSMEWARVVIVVPFVECGSIVSPETVVCVYGSVPFVNPADARICRTATPVTRSHDCPAM